jgi:hypothetical protein
MARLLELSRRDKIVVLLLLIVGMSFFANGFYGLVKSWKLTHHGATAVGFIPVVSDLHQPDLALGQPAVTFMSEGGRRIEYVQRGYGAKRNQPYVTVLYDPKDPAGTATIDEFTPLWYWPIESIAFGSVFLVIVVAIKLYRER